MDSETQEKLKKHKVRNDILLIVGLAVISSVIFLLVFLMRSDGAYAQVEIENKIVATYSLKKDGIYHLNGGTNTLVIKDGEAYMEYGNCKDKICVKTGKISSVGERIVCLPNKISVVIIGEIGDDGIDF